MIFNDNYFVKHRYITITDFIVKLKVRIHLLQGVYGGIRTVDFFLLNWSFARRLWRRRLPQLVGRLFQRLYLARLDVDPLVEIAQIDQGP